MVCAVVYNTHTDEDWDATLEVMMTPVKLGSHSTFSLERYWLHGRGNQRSTGNVVCVAHPKLPRIKVPSTQLSRVGVDCLRVVAVMRRDLSLYAVTESSVRT
jgi:hypothetical protein